MGGRVRPADGVWRVPVLAGCRTRRCSRPDAARRPGRRGPRRCRYDEKWPASQLAQETTPKRRPVTAASAAGAVRGAGRRGRSSGTRHLRDPRRLHRLAHLGDYIYEYGTGEYRHPRTPFGRPPRPPTRSSRSPTTASGTAGRKDRPRPPGAARRGFGRGDLGRPRDRQRHLVRAAPRTTPRTPRAPGRHRQAAAKQTYFEWMSVRPAIAGTTYRRLRFGKLGRPVAAGPAFLPLAAGGTRQRRGRRPGAHPHRPRPARLAQGGLTSSDTTWRLIGNSVMISPFAVELDPRRVAAGARRVCSDCPRRASPSTPTSGTGTPTTAGNCWRTCARTPSATRCS